MGSKKLNKKIIISIVTFFIIVVIITIILIQKNKKNEENIAKNQEVIIEKNVTFVENPTLELGNEFDINKYITEIVGGELIFENHDIDLTKTGKVNIKVKVKDEKGEEKEFSFELNIVDTVPPEILGNTESIEIMQADEINLLEGVTANDGINGAVEVTIEGNYDLNVPGEYNLVYVAVDRQGNRTEKQFKLKVNKKDELLQEERGEDEKNTNIIINNKEDEEEQEENKVEEQFVNKVETTETQKNNVQQEETQNSNVELKNTQVEIEKEEPVKEEIPEVIDAGSYNQSEAKQILDLVNTERSNYVAKYPNSNLSQLSWDSTCESVAKTRAKEISTNFAHASSLPGLSSRARENIASGISSASSVMSSWMSSTSHKTNILLGNAKKMGAAKYVVNGITYWVLIISP